MQIEVNDSDKVLQMDKPRHSKTLRSNLTPQLREQRQKDKYGDAVFELFTKNKQFIVQNKSLRPLNTNVIKSLNRAKQINQSPTSDKMLIDSFDETIKQTDISIEN